MCYMYVLCKEKYIRKRIIELTKTFYWQRYFPDYHDHIIIFYNKDNICNFNNTVINNELFFLFLMFFFFFDYFGRRLFDNFRFNSTQRMHFLLR